MYYPILRGRQNELLAIRELLSADKLAKVVPIIEPVKASSTLCSTIKAFSEKGHPLGIVQNPIVGDFLKDLKSEQGFYSKYTGLLEDFSDLISVVYPSVDSRDQLGSLADSKKMLFYIPEKRPLFNDLMAELNPDYVILPPSDSRMKRRLECKTISLDRSFRVQARNADYRSHDEDRITEENVYFNDDGHCGFADYSVIGEEFSLGGFMPRVVALHLAYVNKEDQNSIWVHHFTSSREIREQDIGRKFMSALDSLVEWADFHDVDETLGLEYFRNLKKADKFPGSGYAKKLAIMHHIELVNNSLLGAGR
jgi:hypothetical protein